MIYGDSPSKINAATNASGLNTYTYVPNSSAIRQRGNLYAYCLNNPVKFVDPDGKSIILTCIIVGAAIGALAGGHFAGCWAKNNDNSNISDNWGWYALCGATGGGIVGGFLGWGIGTIATAIVTKLTAEVAIVATSISGLTLDQVSNMISDVIPNRINHIMQEEHACDLIGATDWSSVSKIIGIALTNGSSMPNEVGNIIYSFVYNGEIIEVTTRIIDDVMRIVDAWVKTR